ncbi:MAG: phosphohydrolase [Aquabacterium sp.]|nr:phosphohydrolase [Aquabacterium sp.]
MQLLPLADLSHALAPGQPLPFNVRDGQGHLLLAAGYLVDSEATLSALLERGIFVDALEAAATGIRPAPAPAAAPAEPPKAHVDPTRGTPFERWDALCDRLSRLLASPGEQYFMQRVREACRHVLALDNVNADLQLYMILRQDHGDFERYGVYHSLHVACVCSLMAQRLGWDELDRQRIIGAALTMNLGIIDLQGQLARQAAPLTRRQRELIDGHPQRAARLLRDAGLDDAEWIEAVQDHHERSGGGGYPLNRTHPGLRSQLLRLADQFTAKHSARATRPALPAQMAARQFFVENPGERMASLMIKEFGIYPPGCLVRLASGEIAIVVRRGAAANTPQVAALTDRSGRVLPAPVTLDTGRAAHAVVGSLPEPRTRLRIPAQWLYPEAQAA